MRVIYVILLALWLGGGGGTAAAENLDDDQLLMRDYRLPQNAVSEKELTLRDSLMWMGGGPFTGTAFLQYDEKQLQHATQYIKGVKHGSMLAWYPDGKPMLLANYRNGSLNGKFKGWYQFGGVIYDLVMRDSTLAGDQIYDADTGRETTGGDDSEPSGDGIEQGND